MKNLLLIIGLVLLLSVGVLIYNYNHKVTLQSSAPRTVSDQPARLLIPRLNIDAQVMNVGQTASGQMDAPVSQAVNSPYWTRVFWYAPGSVPGQSGNAVIAGHVNRVGGDPAVFWLLGSLKTGDKIYIETTKHERLTFRVDRVAHYPANATDDGVLSTVFGQTSAHNLNLITCSGDWNGHTYTERTVVFTSQI